MSHDTRSDDDPEPLADSSIAATRRQVLAAACAAGLATGLTGSFAGSASAAEQPRVVGYYGGWTRYTQEFFPEDVPLESITDLNYAFLTVEADGTVTYADEWGDQENLSVLAERAAEYETNMYVSIGGWNDSTHFSDAAATPEARERFAETAIEIVREYDFDGIDVDWEYPGGGGHEGNVTRPEDPENFALLLEEVRSQLDDAEAMDDATYRLTIAASASPSTAGNLPLERVEPFLEYVTVMTYDFAGGWSEVTGHNAPLYGDGFTVDEAMTWWADGPIPREKLCLGLPFYGQRFEGVPASEDGFGQPFETAESVTYGEIVAAYGEDASVETYRDEEARVPWLYDPEDGTVVSYDDPESIALKVAYALENDFGGVMYWDQAGDPDGTLLEAVHDALENATPGEEGPPPIGDYEPRPAGDDGLYRDVDGSGTLGSNDVVVFFEHVESEAVQSSPAFFDFNGSGSVGFDDVVALFEQV